MALWKKPSCFLMTSLTFSSSVKRFITFLFFPEEYSRKTAGNASCNFSFRTFNLRLPRYAARHQFPDTVKKPLKPPCLPLSQEWKHPSRPCLKSLRYCFRCIPFPTFLWWLPHSPLRFSPSFQKRQPASSHTASWQLPPFPTVLCLYHGHTLSS